MRIVACGQTSEQRPHWMQILASQMGMSWAMLRFSYCVVPVGNVPSTGMALTGRSSPRLAIIMPSTSLTNGRGIGRHRRQPCSFEVTWAGTFTSCSDGQGPVDRGEVPLDDRAAALLAVGLLDRSLMCGDRLLGRNASWPA